MAVPLMPAAGHASGLGVCVVTVEQDTVTTATLTPNPLQMAAYGHCQHSGWILSR
jgi:hypothetical protein